MQTFLLIALLWAESIAYRFTVVCELEVKNPYSTLGASLMVRSDSKESACRAGDPGSMINENQKNGACQQS